MDLPLGGMLALAGRTLGLGLERPLVKALSQGRDSIAATTLYFGIGEVLLLIAVCWQALTDPAYFAQIGQWIIPAAITGVIYAVSFHTYVWGLGVGEVSYLTPLYATAFIWLYFLDVLFGHAQLAVVPALGVLTVTIGIVFLNIAPGARLTQVLNPLTVLRQPGAWGMLVYAFGLATARMVDKGAADVAPPLAYALFNNAPCVLAGLAWLAMRGKAGTIPALLRERTLIAIVGAVAGMGAYVLMLVALDSFNPSVVEPVTQLSVLLAVWLGGVMFHEPVRARWGASLLVVLGAVLLMLH